MGLAIAFRRFAARERVAGPRTGVFRYVSGVTGSGSSKAPSTATGRLTDYLSIGVLTATVPRFVVDEVIAATGRKEKRSRLLPAHVVVYFVMALALFPDGYDEVIRSLVHGLQFARTWSKAWQVPTTGALSQARVRLGEQVVRDLFRRIARPLAAPSTPGGWLGPWRLVAIDGVMLDIPDTAANLDVYEKAVGDVRSDLQLELRV